MSDPVVDRLHSYLRETETELLEDYRTLLRLPSIESEPVVNGPFGQANRDALDFVLGKAQGWGMATTDLEGYAGYAEWGQGDRLIGVFGHLDVVPVGPGWKYPPFGAEVDQGYVYARGAVDDKGPTIAAFYACRALQAVVPELNARLRMVFGCDEESGFQCIERYVKTEEIPTLGIAPDAGWPLYHAEKGIMNVQIEAPLVQASVSLLEFNGGQRHNIVIDQATARVRVTPEARAHVEERLAEAWDRNLEATWAGDELVLNAIGKASHGAWPYGGDNAAIRVLRFLMEVTPLDAQAAYTELFELMHIGGNGIGVAGADEVSKDLTCNVGIVTTQNGTLTMHFNLRYPVTWKGEEIVARIRQHLQESKIGLHVASFTDSPPLYFPLEHPLVRTIVDVYEQETGERRAPGVMGGGTYARAVPNTVAIGTGWEGDGDAHQTNERLKVEHLFRMSRIYAHILYRLATVDLD